ncbi:hypothetical protein GGS24DRAFT_84000 [Hypoxylon argillaceum]|nr:hypothetical protein GGS24DRAFT_84000 [Hypoxylon argillaceum]
MFLFNPLKFVAVPVAFAIALPLALAAGATTILAFLVLFLRLFLVYFDAGVESIRYILVGHATQARYITSHGAPDPSTNSTPLPSPTATTFRHRRRVKRQGSSGSGSITPATSLDGLSAVTPSIGFERDFEGVGGWRLESANEQQWYSLNSRLENPYRRHHFRSQSGGAVMSGPTGPGKVARPGTVTASHSPKSKRTPSPGWATLRTTAANKPQSLVKTDQDGYFPFYEGKNTKKLGV